MNKEILSKMILIIISLALIFPIMHTYTYASAIDNIVTEADNFIKNAKKEEQPFEPKELKTMSDTIYNILLVVGIIIATIVGTVIGIQLMIGGIEQKAKTKEMLIPYLAGCIIIFGAFTIWKILVTILQSA